MPYKRDRDSFGENVYSCSQDHSRVTSAADAENIVSITDSTLISPANSANVAKRVLSYYSSARTVSADLVVGSEKPGQLLGFADPFYEWSRGFLGSLDMTISQVLKAKAEIIQNYVPNAVGNNYSQVSSLSGSGKFVVPSGVTRIRAAVFRGGKGGSGGYRGASAEDSVLPISDWDGGIKILEPTDAVGAGGNPGTLARGKDFRVDMASFFPRPGERVCPESADRRSGANCGSDPQEGPRGRTAARRSYQRQRSQKHSAASTRATLRMPQQGMRGSGSPDVLEELREKGSGVLRGSVWSHPCVNGGSFGASSDLSTYTDRWRSSGRRLLKLRRARRKAKRHTIVML